MSRVRGGVAQPSLATLHRRTTSNVLILHGSKAGRDLVARGFHSDRPAPSGSYCRFDCSQDEEALRGVMRAWIDIDGAAPEPAAPLSDRDCTLFVDSVETLSPASQRLLLVLLRRLAETSAVGRDRPVGRLIAGSSTDLERVVAAGLFLPQLYDALNKIRVVLKSGAMHQGSSSPCRK